MADHSFQNSLENSGDLFRAIVSQSGEGISVCDHEGKYLFVNEAFCAMTGYSARDFARMTVRDLIPPGTELSLFNKVVNQQAGGRELELIRKNGERFWVEAKGYPLQLNGQALVLCTIRDITRRKTIEKQLQESEEKFRASFEASPDAVNLNRVRDGMYVEINPGFTRIMGYLPEDVAGKTSLELNIWHDQADRQEVVRLLREEGQVDAYEAEFLSKSGELKTGLMSAKIVEVAGEKMILSITRDITLLRQSEQTMALLEFAINHIDETVFLIDESSSRITYVNDAACGALGYSKAELLELKIAQIVSDFQEEAYHGHRQQLDEVGSLKFETVHRRKDGTTFPVEVFTSKFAFYGTSYRLALVHDISERKRNEEERRKLEQQMQQAQKLESLGVLAGGIAHDFNNLLAVIMGYTELLLTRLPTDSRIKGNLKKILEAGGRAVELSKQMLAYSGKGHFLIEPVNLNGLLEGMLSVFRISAGKNINVTLSPAEPLPFIDVDAVQIRQVIMNLVNNAIEAIGAENGEVTIATGWFDYRPEKLANLWLSENLSEGHYVYLDVSDTGIGMDQGTLDKLFDPFFTTKFTGRGLGMSAVFGIVRGHRGAIQVCSEPGHGTTFRVLFPASQQLEVTMPAHVEEEKSGRKKTVLLVDDEKDVRDVAMEMLEELGVDVVTAVDGLDAVQVYQKNSAIGLVILDLTMPRMDGVACYRELKRINPDLKIIMASGYSEHEVSQKFVGQKIAGFLQKPYQLSELMQLVKGGGCL